jgi:hypothetical protein
MLAEPVPCVPSRPLFKRFRPGQLQKAARLTAVGVELNVGLPAGGRNRRFEAQPADDLLDVCVDAILCRDEGRHDDAARIFEIVAVEAA